MTVSQLIDKLVEMTQDATILVPLSDMNNVYGDLNNVNFKKFPNPSRNTVSKKVYLSHDGGGNNGRG
jgi:hypothetical protein